MFVIKVEGILKEITKKIVSDIFGLVGNLISVKIIVVSDTQRYALIEYSTKEAAEKAIRKFNGKQIKYNGRHSDVFKVYMIESTPQYI